MIIKSLWKAVKWATLKTPVPELSLFVGLAGISWALYDAYSAKSTEQITKQVPVENDIEDDSGEPKLYHVDVEIIRKTAPADVWDCLGGNKFSIREAIKTYNSMDTDAKRIFKVSAISMACVLYYAVASSARGIAAANENFELEFYLALERGWAERTVSTAESEMADAQRIVNKYKSDFAENKWADNPQAYCNYRNQLHDIMIFGTMVDTYKTVKETKIS